MLTLTSSAGDSVLVMLRTLGGLLLDRSLGAVPESEPELELLSGCMMGRFWLGGRAVASAGAVTARSLACNCPIWIE